MTPWQFIMLILVAAIWGASFMFTRIAGPQFGPFALIGVRVFISAVFLIPFVTMRASRKQIRSSTQKILFLGVVNTAIPFTLYAYATLHLGAGIPAILNSTVPLFTALVARVWIGEKLKRPQIAGLFIGFTGVIFLSWEKLTWKSESGLFPILAGLCASLMYGYSANLTKLHLSKVHPMVIAAVSQVGATLFILPFSITHLPSVMPSQSAWLCAAALGIFCTGLAYVLFFKLVEEVGATRAITLTFLIPAFAVLWGYLFLGERITPTVFLGTTTILLGTALATGVLRRPFGRSKIRKLDSSRQ